MDRIKAEQLDCEIRECLNDFSIKYKLQPEFANLIMDKYLEIIPDDLKRDMIFLGKESASYKPGNIQFDLKNTLITLVEYIASLSEPETLFHYIQLAIVSVLCVRAITKKELDYNCAVIVSVLHKRNAYEIGFTSEQIKEEIEKMSINYRVEDFEMENFDKTINNLLTWNVIYMEEEKIYLNEIVWGNIE